MKFSYLLFVLLVFPACMAPKGEPPAYSREFAYIDKLVLKEDLLRFRLKLEMRKFPEEYFHSSHASDTHQHNERFRELVGTVLDKLIEDYTIIAYGIKKGVVLSRDALDQKVEERQKKNNPKSFENFLNENEISFSRWRQLIEDEIKAGYVLEQEIGKDIKVSMDEIQNYYYKNLEVYDVPERVRVRHIVTDSLKKANEVYARILSGENFAKLAVNHSIAPERSKGGDLGYFARGTFPKEFDDACFKLTKGEVSPIVKSSYGYHIFKLLDKKPTGRKTITEVAPQIQQILYGEKLKARYDSWLAEAKKQVIVEIKKEVVDNIVL